MPELSGAVARAQLRKLEAVVHRRRHSAERLTQMISGLPGIGVPGGAGVHAFWYYPLLVDGLDESVLRRYAAALNAEGVPCVPGYIAQPLYREPVVAEPTAYGGSGYPISGRIDYPPGTCPEAEEMVSRRLLVLPWNENFTDEHVCAIGEAIRKVHRAVMSA